MIDKEFYDNLLDKAEGMSVSEFIDHLVKVKSDDNKLTWSNIKNLVNEAFGLDYSEEYYRIHNCDKLNALSSVYCDDVSNIREELVNLQKERVKFRDEANANRKYIRDLARKETIRDIAVEAAIAAAKEKPYIPNKVVEGLNIDNAKYEAILEIGDWHYGLVFKNFINEYSPEICKKRVAELFKKVVERLQFYNIKKLYVVDLSDLIAGRIHKTIQLESRCDVITQIMEVTEILADLLYNLSKYVKVEYYSTIDNHSRLEPDKEASLAVETLQRLTPWYLEQRLKDCDVNINENFYGDDICAFEVLGHKILGVHGDKDSHVTAVDKLSMMTEQHWDLLCTAHLHHFSGDEKNRTVVCSCSSLMGTDTYAKDLRLTSTPSQNLIIVSKENVIEAICRIILH